MKNQGREKKTRDRRKRRHTLAPYGTRKTHPTESQTKMDTTVNVTIDRNRNRKQRKNHAKGPNQRTVTRSLRIPRRKEPEPEISRRRPKSKSAAAAKINSIAPNRTEPTATKRSRYIITLFACPMFACPAQRFAPGGWQHSRMLIAKSKRKKMTHHDTVHDTTIECRRHVRVCIPIPTIQQSNNPTIQQSNNKRGNGATYTNPFQLWIGCTDRLRRSYRPAQHYWYCSECNESSSRISLHERVDRPCGVVSCRRPCRIYSSSIHPSVPSGQVRHEKWGTLLSLIHSCARLR
jgi:hypothetical protein